jgi:PhzF family phenazine biosynthesis protein
MTKIPFAQIDAFASNPFEGNQACVMPLDAFLPDATLQAIAAENNVAETAFIVADGEGRWQLRWFTPAVEVPLCGHATLASAHYIFEAGYTGEQITFQTVQSGELFVSRVDDGRLEMNFPKQEVRDQEITDDIVEALGARPIRAFAGPFYAAVFDSVETLNALSPDYKALASLGYMGDAWGAGNFGCLALGGNGVDVTSRFFGPGSGIDEDPATGSWHCMLAPVVEILTGETSAECYQAYPGRGAQIETEIQSDRVKLRGRSVTVIEGVFNL